MESLPLEIWHKIFSSFSLKEKMECMSVCRSWWKFFDKYTLLSHVEIKDNQAQFTAFMDMIKQLPHRRLQVETLELNNCIPLNYNKRKLCNTFSTVRILRVVNDKDRGTKLNLQRKPLKTMPSSTQIEYLCDSFRCELASQMLVSNLCDRLDTLQLDFLGVIGANRIFDELKHAPVLQQLSLRSVAIDLGDLETIHHNAPSLKALRMEWINMRQSDDFPSNVMAATCVTTLHFTVYDASDPDTHAKLYRYMARKYINVKDMKHQDAKIHYYDDHDLRLFCFNGYMDFLKLIAPNLKKSRPKEVGDPSTAYFRFFMKRLQDLRYHHVLQQNEFYHLRELVLNKAEPNSPEVLKYLPVLKTLKLDFTGRNDPNTIDVTSYFNACPESVKEVNIDCFEIEFDPDRMKECFIESLTIDCGVIDERLSILVRRCPALRRLKISGYLDYYQGNFSIPRESPFEEMTFVLDRTYPFGFRYKDITTCTCSFYLSTSEHIRLATFDDISKLQTLCVTSFKGGRVVFDDNNTIRILPN